MSVKTVAHVNLRGNARAALEFYRSVLGGDLVAVTYADARAATEPAEADHIMWGQVVSAAGFHIMAFDVPSERPYHPGENSYFVSVRGEDAEEIRGYWNKFREGAAVISDLAPSGWAPLYGMLTDRFGVTWTLDVATEYAPARVRRRHRGGGLPRAPPRLRRRGRPLGPRRRRRRQRRKAPDAHLTRARRPSGRP